MAANNMNNLTTLIKRLLSGPTHSPDSALTRLTQRLEAATSRLEDIASSSSSFETTPSLNGSVGTATARNSQVPAVSVAAQQQQSPTAALPPSIQAFDELLNGDLKEFARLSDILGSVIREQAVALSRAFKAQRQVLLVSTKAKKPDIQSQVYLECLKELQGEMEAVNEIREANRASPFKDNLAMLVEGVGALGWITVEPKPADFVSEVLGGVQLYGNRILKEYKDKERAQIEWTQSFYKLCKSLITYIKQHYGTGLTWNRDGIDAAEALRQVRAGQSSANGSSPAAGGLPPPPPPPLPNFDVPPPAPPSQPSRNANSGDMGAVFDELNKGEAITSGLRKVDKSEMTHKNPSLRASATVPSRSDSSSSLGRSKSPAPPGKKPKPDSMRTKKPERKELDGNKWIIENFESPSQPIEIEASLSHSILISRCKSTTIRIQGKANAVSIDSSARVALILDSLVSSVDVIKSPHFALQVLGTLPTIMLDQVDGATLYLGKDSLNTEIFTSKCTGVNVNLPPGEETEDDDYREFPLPEQIRSYVRDGHMVSEIVEHAG